MSRPRRHTFPDSNRRAQALGERLRLARLRRRISETDMAARAGVSRMTVWRLERGDSSVSLAILLRVLEILDLDREIDLIAREDVLGSKLQDVNQPGPRRAVRRRVADEL